MMCHRMGRSPISIIGFGMRSVSAAGGVAKAQARITAFISLSVASADDSAAQLPFYSLSGRTLAFKMQKCKRRERYWPPGSNWAKLPIHGSMAAAERPKGAGFASGHLGSARAAPQRER